MVMPIALESFRAPAAEACACADHGRPVGEGGAAAVEGLGEILDGGEGLVGDGLVGERPQALAGPRLGRMGRQQAD